MLNVIDLPTTAVLYLVVVLYLVRLVLLAFVPL